jgi:hypothetical protein
MHFQWIERVFYNLIVRIILSGPLPYEKPNSPVRRKKRFKDFVESLTGGLLKCKSYIVDQTHKELPLNHHNRPHSIDIHIIDTHFRKVLLECLPNEPSIVSKRRKSSTKSCYGCSDDIGMLGKVKLPSSSAINSLSTESHPLNYPGLFGHQLSEIEIINFLDSSSLRKIFTTPLKSEQSIESVSVDDEDEFGLDSNQ